jgi:hypothetical protein
MGPSHKGKEREEPFLRKPDRTDKAVAGTQMVAGAVGTIGAFAPVPFIKEAADAALYLAQIVKVRPFHFIQRPLNSWLTGR